MQFKTCVLIFSAVSLFACSSTPKPQAQVEPIIYQQADDMEVVQKGFSLSFPNQDEWTVVKKEPYKVVMTKPDLTNNGRYTIQALVVKLPTFKDDQDFMKFISSRMKNSQKQSSVKVIEEHAKLVEGENEMCVQYNSKEQHPGKTKPVILEIINFTCRHTEKENVGVYLAYSNKYSQGKDDKNFAVNGVSLFSYMKSSSL